MTLLTTGVGSVPFDDPEDAVEHVFRAYTLPFFPQVVRAAPAGMPPMVWEVFVPGLEQATPAAADAKIASLPGLAAFLARLGRHDQAKTQLAGPETLRTCLGTLSVEAAWRWCQLMTEAWVRALRSRSDASLLVVWDEGLLLPAGPAAIERFLALKEQLSDQSVRLGLHTCAPCDVAALAKALPGVVLSVDAHVSTLLTPSGLAAAAAHARQGGDWIVGAVDTRPDVFPSAEEAERVARATRAFAFALSGGCGTGLRPVEVETALAAALTQATQAS